jgi:integrase/recombinase XerD
MTLTTTSPAPLARGTDSAEVARAFLTGYRGNTRMAYATDLQAFFRWCASAGLDPLNASRQAVEQYARDLESQGRTPSTVARKLATLSGFYSYATDEGILPLSPVQRVRRPRVGRESQTLGLDRDQACTFLAQAAAASPRDHALACLLILNGLRASEAAGLNVADLGTERGHQIIIVAGKGGTSYRVPLAPRTAEAIREHLDGRTDGPLLLSNGSGPLTRSDVSRIVRRLAHRANLPRVSPHGLRHTAVTLALDAGASLRDVQDFARHADPRTTRRYDTGRHSLDRHATYALSGYLAGS